jgi:predicted ATPase
MWSKGFSSEETRAAFARVIDFAASGEDATVRFAAYDAECQSSFMRGEFNKAQEIAETFLREAEAEGRATEAGAARRALGFVLLFQGNLRAARSILERALTDYRPERDGDTQRRFNRDTEVTSAAYLALAEWHLGEVERARVLIERSIRRANELGYAATIANALFWRTILESRRDDVPATCLAAEAALEISENHGIKSYADLSRIYAAWARGRLKDPEAGAEELERVLAAFLTQGNKVDTPSCHGMLAEVEAMVRGAEQALARIGQGLAISEETGERITDSYLYRLRGDILLKCDPADPVPAEEAYRTAIAVAKEQGARSFELLASLSLAKLYQSTGRPVEANSVLAPAIEGFAPTPEMPQIGEAQTLLAALAATDEVRAQVAQRHRLTQLQVSYGNALIAARGHTAPETTEAFAKVREFGAGGADFRELAAADYGLWVASYGRGELPPMRVHSAAFLEDVAARPDSVEACVAHRVAGSTHWFAGEYREAREHLERAVALFQPGRDDDVAFRFGQDAGVAATLFLAIVLWVLGDIARAIALAQQTHERIERIPHASTRAYGKLHMALFELIRGEVSRAAPNALELGRVARENDLPLFRALAVFLEAWAKSQIAGSADAREEMSRAADVLRERNIRCFDGPLKLAHAQEEARLGDPERAISIIDDAMADFDRRGHRAMDAELRRLRGEILLKRTPADPAPAEDAYRTAIAVAKQQGTRSFELRAALALAKLYQSTARPTEAHAVLAPALEGFAPTPEMPEIGEAQALLTALEASEEVKGEAAQRQRRAQLHVAYGNALIATRGYSARETGEAFARARESATGNNAGPERLAADYGLWVGSYASGELSPMRAHAETFLSDVQARPDSPEAGVAHRAAGITHWFAGEYCEAREHLERALTLFQPGRDDDLAFRFGQDQGVAAVLYLALTLWPLGDIGRAISLVGEAEARSASLAHVGTRAYGTMHAAMFELMRGDLSRAASKGHELAQLAHEHGLPVWRAFGVFLQGLADAQSDSAGGGLEDMRRGIELQRDQNVLSFAGLLKIALAETEARAGDIDRALAILGEALATSERIGHRTFDAELHSVRGEMLLKHDPANPAPAEEALLTAIAIAKRQATRSFELRAALALAKLYQSTARPAEAHAVLASALEGFAPTPEMPEIAEAREMFAAIEAGPYL